jgi:Fe-S-cluster containining protein
MIDLNYICLKCGVCCFQIAVPPPSSGTSLYKKRIPLYPDEAEKLIEIAKKRNIPFLVIEDLVFPDILNKKILVVTYRIRLDNESQGCPFYDKNTGCTVHEIKPLTCQAYPLALKQEDAFNFKITIDPLCHFVKENYETLKIADLEQIKNIFHEEYPKAEKHLKKNKKIMLKIKKLEIKKKIQITRQIKLEDFNNYLKEWERVEIIA